MKAGVKIIVFSVLIGFLTFACASSRSGSVYTRDQARVIHTVYKGIIESIKPVKIEGTKTPVGAVAGGATGAVLGSTVGRGSGRALATIVGAIAGGVAGSAAEEKITEKKGQEITVNLDNGDTLVIVQEADPELYPGMRVNLLRGSDGTARVRPE